MKDVILRTPRTELAQCELMGDNNVCKAKIVKRDQMVEGGVYGEFSGMMRGNEPVADPDGPRWALKCSDTAQSMKFVPPQDSESETPWSHTEGELIAVRHLPLLLVLVGWCTLQHLSNTGT